MLTKNPSALDMYVLDVVADDVESLEHVLGRLNADSPRAWWKRGGTRFTREEVVAALSRLVSKDLVRVLLPDSADGRLVEMLPGALPPFDYADAWYRITPRGLLVHNNWELETP